VWGHRASHQTRSASQHSYRQLCQLPACEKSSEHAANLPPAQIDWCYNEGCYLGSVYAGPKHVATNRLLQDSKEHEGGGCNNTACHTTACSLMVLLAVLSALLITQRTTAPTWHLQTARANVEV
jgi:hypothetical protein